MCLDVTRTSRFRPPPAVLTISSADVDPKNSKKTKSEFLHFLVLMLPHSASGKVHQELATSFSEGFPSFLSLPPQPMRATSPAVGQGLRCKQIQETQQQFQHNKWLCTASKYVTISINTTRPAVFFFKASILFPEDLFLFLKKKEKSQYSVDTQKFTLYVRPTTNVQIHQLPGRKETHIGSCRLQRLQLTLIQQSKIM
jgi:hypothetical protein